ncbi:MAG: ABC transporter [Pelagibacteraceae bacterium]|nr:ABC transporter [Pelagibacteraceae bacterium]|tara:strand:- start:832 stop:1755 length:924 start_codon:yes stop_codon:yes gene_type:complete
MSKNIAIKINNLSKIYKNQKTYSLDNISLEIKSGIIFGLLGPNGAGKSTIINILADLVYKTSGSIEVLGKDYSKELNEIKPRIGIVPQELNMDPFFTPFELLELQAGLYGVPKEKRQTKKILKLLALEDKADAYARTLSGGMKRRLLIAKAMVHDPEILILDEPTAGVDVELRQTLWDNIRSLKTQGKTIIITTHYLHEAENLCDEIAIINKGKLLVLDETKKIKSKMNYKKITIEHDDSKVIDTDIFKDLKISFIKGINSLTIEYDPKLVTHQNLLQKLAGLQINIKDIKIEDNDFEELFIKLINK